MLEAPQPDAGASQGAGTRPVVILRKHEGNGNDFLVLFDPRRDEAIGEGLVRWVCDRRLGVGADGLIRVILTVI